MILSHETLAQAHDDQNWPLLHQQALPLARYAIRRLIQGGTLDPYYTREDVMQEAFLAALEATRTWNPLEGSLSLWIVAQVRWAILQYIAGEAKTAAVSTTAISTEGDNWDDEPLDFGAESRISYEVPPDGLGDPAMELELRERPEFVRKLLCKLRNPLDIEMLVALYGLNGVTTSQDEYAAELGVPVYRVRKRLRKILQFLSHSAHG